MKSFKDVKNDIDIELSFLIEKKYEYLILGCTHYSLIPLYIEKYLNTKTIDPTENIINRIANILSLENDETNNTFFYNENVSTNWRSCNLDYFKFINL